MKISLITVVLNNARNIGSCLESVSSQTYSDIEHIIIDGGSTDGTLEVIKTGDRSGLIGDGSEAGNGSEVIGNRQLQNHDLSPITHNLSRVSRLISEPDNGIYDALNKGIRLAKGDVIGFLHADDIYADNTVIGKVAKRMSEQDVDSCYGDLVYVRDSWQAIKLLSLQGDKQDLRQTGKTDKKQADKPEDDSRFTVVRYWKSRPYEKGLFRKGWMPPHPTFFARREVYEELGTFDTAFNIAADYELMLRFLWRNNISTCYIPQVLVKMRLGGASNGSLRNVLKKSAEDYRAIKMHEVGGFATLFRKNVSKIPQFFKTGNG